MVRSRSPSWKRSVERSARDTLECERAGLLELLLNPGAGDLLVCSHGELIGAVLRRLIGRELQADSWPKGSTWVLEVVRGQLRDSRYPPPPRLQATNAGYY
jgi:hypothetical protein